MSYYNGNKNNMSTEEAYYWSTGLIVCFLLSGPFFQLGLFHMLNLGMKFRVSLCALIYRKVLRSSKSAKTETTAGQVKIFLYDNWGSLLPQTSFVPQEHKLKFQSNSQAGNPICRVTILDFGVTDYPSYRFNKKNFENFF